MSIDEDIALERTLKAYAQDCQVYRQCIKSILEVLKDSPDDDWIVKYISPNCDSCYEQNKQWLESEVRE